MPKQRSSTYADSAMVCYNNLESEEIWEHLLEDVPR
jgi:hypothetical protein